MTAGMFHVTPCNQPDTRGVTTQPYALDYDYDEVSDLVNLRRELNRKLRVYRRTAAQYAIAVEAALEVGGGYTTLNVI
jgi:hypothetical protein